MVRQAHHEGLVLDSAALQVESSLTAHGRIPHATERHCRQSPPIFEMDVREPLAGVTQLRCLGGGGGAHHALARHDVSKMDMSMEIFGTTYASPICIAPTGGNKAYHADGEMAVARAARVGNHLEMLASGATTSINDAIEARGGPVWFQLYATSSWEVARARRMHRAAVSVGPGCVRSGRCRARARTAAHRNAGGDAAVRRAFDQGFECKFCAQVLNLKLR